MGYIGAHGVAALKRYKYSDNTHAVYVLGYISSAWLCLFPSVGFTTTKMGSFCTWVTSISISGLYLLAGNTFDAVDGKQARKTNSSSPLGELFDHGSDALACAFETMAFGSTAMCGGDSFWFWVISAVPFYGATWEHYFTNTLILPVVNGPTEGLALIYHRFFPCKVPSGGLSNLDNPYPSSAGYLYLMMPRFLCTAQSHSSLLYIIDASVQNVHKVVQAQKGSMLLALAMLYPFVVLMGGVLVWDYLSLSDIMGNYPHLVIVGTGLAFGFLVSLLYLPLAIANALTARLNDGYNAAFLVTVGGSCEEVFLATNATLGRFCYSWRRRRRRTKGRARIGNEKSRVRDFGERRVGIRESKLGIEIKKGIEKQKELELDLSDEVEMGYGRLERDGAAQSLGQFLHSTRNLFVKDSVIIYCQLALLDFAVKMKLIHLNGGRLRKQDYCIGGKDGYESQLCGRYTEDLNRQKWGTRAICRGSGQRVEVATMYLTEKQKYGLMVILCRNIIGLRDDIKHRVKALDPKNMSEASHHCKTGQLNMITEESDTPPVEFFPTNSEQSQQTEEETLEISMNTIIGSIGHTTLRIQGTIQGKSLNILIDSGSTHIFFTPKWADAGIQITTPHPLAITVANDQQLFRVSSSISMELQPILEKYNSVFDEPQGLPPQRSHDHFIPLKLNASPVNLRPYRFHHNQKVEVERQITTMLSSSVIQPSRSPFASPCLLIKKKDGTWRFELNQKISARLHLEHTRDIMNLSSSMADHTTVEYLGHIISAAGVSTDPSKVEAMHNWPKPKSLKSLRGFLGLTGYYRRFIKNYGIISMPLTQMLKKDVFQWNSAAYSAFEDLKQAMSSAPVLALPDFAKTFCLETDASSGEVNYHYSKKGLTKLLGLDYTIQYRKGKSNVVVDALSRTWEDQAQCLAMGVTVLVPTWVHEIEDSVVLRYDGRVYIGAKGSLRLKIIQTLHDSPQGGYSGAQATYYRIRIAYFFKKNCILALVDKFTKYNHFLPLSYPYSTAEVAKLYLDSILFNTAYHPETDGHTERVNQCLEQYLRGIYFYQPRYCAKWLPQAEWWYNTTYHTTLKLTPFQALYGYKPHIMVWPTYTSVQSVSEIMANREHMRQLVKHQLELASNRMKQQADKSITERVFQVGELVYLKLQPYRQSSIALRKNLKLTAKYFGPYKILEKIGKVAYRLDLPDSSRLHPVFHVNLLKRFIGASSVIATDPPAIEEDGQFQIKPLKILGRRIVNRNGKLVTQLLVRWQSLDESNNTWEDYTFLRDQFPAFDLWGQGSSRGAGLGILEKEGLGIRESKLGIEIKKGIEKQKELDLSDEVEMGYGRLERDGAAQSLGPIPAQHQESIC
ncbi:Choline/ethanolaminephosphotransferase 1 [Hibiscus syriacus]|uniref:Choline/ethanolaminephosphotransferase 1 n=1 Tax=Hibiscus syriacus TaxID=106335 RepID=A0A6A2WIX1_HIBSY|nr:Choline/ethanolaminephosphotransferase 1 [Hibiscus syriacus]